MNAMWTAFAAIVVIAAVAGVVLDSVGTSSAERYSTPSTRLN